MYPSIIPGVRACDLGSCTFATAPYSLVDSTTYIITGKNALFVCIQSTHKVSEDKT